jgi:hypothetical protein
MRLGNWRWGKSVNEEQAAVLRSVVSILVSDDARSNKKFHHIHRFPRFSCPVSYTTSSTRYRPNLWQRKLPEAA